MTWLVYGIAAVMMLAVVVVAILAGLALRLVAEFFWNSLQDPRRAVEGHRRRQA